MDIVMFSHTVPVTLISQLLTHLKVPLRHSVDRLKCGFGQPSPLKDILLTPAKSTSLQGWRSPDIWIEIKNVPSLSCQWVCADVSFPACLIMGLSPPPLQFCFSCQLLSSFSVGCQFHCLDIRLASTSLESYISAPAPNDNIKGSFVIFRCFLECLSFENLHENRWMVIHLLRLLSWVLLVMKDDRLQFIRA